MNEKVRPIGVETFSRKLIDTKIVFTTVNNAVDLLQLVSNFLNFRIFQRKSQNCAKNGPNPTLFL